MNFLKHIEDKWQNAWETAKIFEANPDRTMKKFYATFPYPYMNGPLHVGHAFTASRVDAYVRFKRMQGYNVLFPWAWHWTGQPLGGASERIAKGDEALIKVLKEMDGVPEEELQKFVDPIYMATYYTNESRTVAKKAGFSIDWSREFNTIAPTYQKFIEWQYHKLKSKGYVSKGTHPVVWCPKCQSPTGDHDRQVGEGIAPEEYTLIKFKLDEQTYLPAATFRPETVYGVTNMWINPDAKYVAVKIDSEKWIISKEAAEKLQEQGRSVEVKRELEGRELIGKTFENPVNKNRLLILPGWFVSPQQASGVVYSVPAHAPYDWLALKDLKAKPEVLHEFNIDPKMVNKIKPISLIKVEGFKEYPAIEIVEQLNAKNQYDPKAEEATKLLYKREFHNGILKDNCKEYAGKLVKEVKDVLIQDLKKQGIADTMYDLPQAVVCRCLTPCLVKVLHEQWFLNYSNQEWKAKTKEALGKMKLYPETATQWFLTVIDWLKEWACARRTGFGTPLPWGQNWIIETLSDSTIYMAFYTINKHITQHQIQPENLSTDVFDFIFYGEGDIKTVASQSQIKPEILADMQNEFLYWYPVDLRVSAKELVPNHLTFFIFHHVALFARKHWPKAIGVNGMLMIEGKQMHKSKGNFVTMKKAIGKYGADPTRCALLLAAGGMDDPNWRSENVRDSRNKLESFYKFVKNVSERKSDEERGHLEKWLISKIQNRIMTVTDALELMKTRTALEIAFFEIWNDFRWYIRRKSEVKIPREALKIWIRLLAPFSPHICEEIWKMLGNEEFVSLSSWPKPNQNLRKVKVEESENYIKNIMEDTQNIIRATKVIPTRIYYYISASWKWKLYLTTLEVEGKQEVSQVIQEMLKDPDLRGHAKEVSKLAPKMAEEVRKMSQEKRERQVGLGKIDEFEIFKKTGDFLNREFRVEIRVFNEDDEKRYDPQHRSKSAKPYRPAIYIE